MTKSLSLKWRVGLTTFFLSALLIPSFFSMFSHWHEHESSDKKNNHLASLMSKNQLVVRVINSPFSLVDSDYSKGFNVELVDAFVTSLGLELDIEHIASIDEIQEEVDIIIGVSNAPNSNWVKGPALYTHNLQLVSLHTYQANELEKKSLGILSLSQSIKNQTSAQDILKQDPSNKNYTLDNSDQSHQFKFSTVIAHQDNNSFIPLINLANKESDFALVDSVSAALFRRIEPNLKIIANISENEEFAWFFYSPSADESLLNAFKSFHASNETETLLAKLAEKYFNIISSFDKSQTYYFVQAVEKKLPEFEPLFKQYAGEFDWRLIAAIAYQESHWDPKAKSPTGVRGMMMLTLDTAKYLGVDDRLDTEKSIIGGIEYLRFLLKRIPQTVDEDDKIWFALAAYNMGIGHLWDARELTLQSGGDPDKWHDLKNHLPKLRDENVYPDLKYGYARGDEALIYVENIRRFYTTLLGLDRLEDIESKRIEKS
ncbi:membrane-bound lytic murein transglycosylase MltF [Thorsellia kenyensis]|uniref:peptidoglycan lytic exotransglycosylase n=1 Tax=Thorsellia kenyensis TaxID=1549888 RepID=A0ABV6CI15_9GAMM